MEYTIKAHPTRYGGVQFRSRLEARWAAFFDLAGWQWEYEPIDLKQWSPDFRVTFPCRHSECSGSHSLLVEVKPYFEIAEFAGHPCMDYPNGGWPKEEGGKGIIPADASAAFGANPSVSQWEMAHGGGGGIESVDRWVSDATGLWNAAGATVQWKGQPAAAAPTKTAKPRPSDREAESLHLELLDRLSEGAWADRTPLSAWVPAIIAGLIELKESEGRSVTIEAEIGLALVLIDEEREFARRARAAAQGVRA